MSQNICPRLMDFFGDTGAILNYSVSRSFPVGCSEDKFTNLLLERPIIAITETIEFKMAAVSQKLKLPHRGLVWYVEHWLPSSCTAFSQAFAVNWFRWRISNERSPRTTWPETNDRGVTLRPRNLARTFVMHMTWKLLPANPPTVTLAKHIPQKSLRKWALASCC